MLTLFRLCLILCFLISLISCRSRVYRAGSGEFLTAQQEPAPVAVGRPGYIQAKHVSIASIKEAKNKVPLLLRAKQVIVKKAKQVNLVKKHSERVLTNRLTAAKELKKSRDFRIVDVLFFVILALLLTVALILLKQVGYGSDAITFMAMGAAVIIALAYIYFHTWMFTA